MQKLLIRSLIFSSFFLTGSVICSAAISFTLALPDTTTTEVDISPGDSFSLRLDLTSTAELTTGVTYFFTISGAGGSGNFSIESRNISGSLFTELTTSNSTVLNPINSLLDPTNNNDLGAGVADLGVPTPVGTHLVANFTFSSNPAVSVGTYILSLTSVDVVDEGFNSLPSSSNQFTVNVIPEPTAAILLALGLLGLVTRRRR